MFVRIKWKLAWEKCCNAAGEWCVFPLKSSSHLSSIVVNISARMFCQVALKWRWWWTSALTRDSEWIPEAFKRDEVVSDHLAHQLSTYHATRCPSVLLLLFFFSFFFAYFNLTGPFPLQMFVLLLPSQDPDHRPWPAGMYHLTIFDMLSTVWWLWSPYNRLLKLDRNIRINQSAFRCPFELPSRASMCVWVFLDRSYSVYLIYMIRT